MKYTFRLIAFDETKDWQIPMPAGSTKAFGVYLFREGEATHCASLLPSSWCKRVEDVFPGAESEAEVEYLQGIGDDMYVSFINPDMCSDRVSDPIEIEADSAEEAWEEAFDYVRSNAQSIPCLNVEEPA